MAVSLPIQGPSIFGENQRMGQTFQPLVVCCVRCTNIHARIRCYGDARQKKKFGVSETVLLQGRGKGSASPVHI
jgi:hypothetical protein